MSWPTFEEPLWLVGLLPVVLLILIVVRTGRPAVPARQHRWAVITRIAAVVMLFLAAAQPTFALEVPDRAVLFVVDRSASISPETRAEQEAFVAEALQAGGPEDVAGVAVFGEELKVDASLAVGRIAEPIRTVVGEGATNLESAVRAATALLPTEGSRRIILLTDGVATEGDVQAATREAAAQGIAVDVVQSPSGGVPDVLIEAVEVPAAARVGETVGATIVVRANQSGPAELLIQTGSGEPEAMAVDLVAGLNEFDVEYPAADAGFLRIGAQVRASFDTRVDNNAAEGLVRVLGPAQVAVVEGLPGESDQLAAALVAAGFDVDRLSSIPEDNALLSYDVVVLVNVSAPSSEEADRLSAFVENLGRGLVVVGGDNAYGLGGYHDTSLESILPVHSNPDDLVRRQQVAEVLVIDTSGSMGTCHARGDNFIEGGVNKTDISRAGAHAAIDALSDQDRVGVLAFSSGTSWAIPLGPKLSEAEIEAALGLLTPAGDTEIAAGLDEALAELKGADEDLRHIILFTDGWDPNEADLLPIAEDIADAGVTLSVVGTGEGAGTTLLRMAQLGGGRYYSGANLGEIPEIFVEETLTVARSLAQEGSFIPMLGSASPVTDELEATPPLRGYVLTKAKGTAATPLLIGEEDPLLATWQRGLGRVSAWTSDATSRWLADWVTWDGYVGFWGSVVADVVPGGRENPPEVAVSGGMLSIEYDAGDVSLDAAGVATVRTPTAEILTVPLRRTGTSQFSGEVRVGESGAYWVAVSVSEDGQTLASGSSGAVSSYADEFSFREADPRFAADVTSVTGGRVNPVPEDAFARAPVTGKSRRSVWPWLATVALLLFMADVALRRLVLTDAVTVRSAKRAGEEVPDEELPAQPEPVVESETVGRLLQRKRR